MKQLQDWLASVVRARMQEASSGAAVETRLIFHGPPLEILAGVFTRLIAGEPPPLPVLLQVPRLPDGTRNPPSGGSGLCDDGHLLDLRNSPQASSYVALVPPGQHAIRSVTSTTDEFGMLAASNGANVDFDDWWGDPFLQSVVDSLLVASRLEGNQLEDARDLISRAARAFDGVEVEQGRREAAWRLVARAFEATSEPARAATRLALACGMPSTPSGKLDAGQQVAVLDSVVSALSEGFSTGLASAREAATPEQQAWLDAFLEHIRATCTVPTALERSPQAFYSPASGLGLVEPPAWWTGLDTDIWAELLDDEPEIVGDIRIECANPLLPTSRGVPLLVAGAVELSITTVAEEAGSIEVLIERSPGRSSGGFPMSLSIDGSGELFDATPPLHKAPLQYKASANGFRTASAKVVSLAAWAPGLFIGCRNARKVVPPKAPSRRTKGVNWEATVTLPGPGRYELLVFLSPGSALAGNATGISGSEAGLPPSDPSLIMRVQGC